jgi:hypothetical protein
MVLRKDAFSEGETYIIKMKGVAVDEINSVVIRQDQADGMRLIGREQLRLRYCESGVQFFEHYFFLLGDPEQEQQDDDHGEQSDGELPRLHECEPGTRG